MSEQVQYDNGSWAREVEGIIPTFDGKPVDMTKVKVMATSDLDCDDAVLRMDDIVRVVVEARVTQIHHNVNERTGQLVRLQGLKPLSVEIVPWNPAQDKGVV